MLRALITETEASVPKVKTHVCSFLFRICDSCFRFAAQYCHLTWILVTNGRIGVRLWEDLEAPVSREKERQDYWEIMLEDWLDQGSRPPWRFSEMRALRQNKPAHFGSSSWLVVVFTILDRTHHEFLVWRFMGNLGEGCDIFAKLNERQIKNKLCSNRQKEVTRKNTKRKNDLEQRDTMANVKYDAIFCDYPLCTELILESRYSYYRGLFVCL